MRVQPYPLNRVNIKNRLFLFKSGRKRCSVLISYEWQFCFLYWNKSKIILINHIVQQQVELIFFWKKSCYNVHLLCNFVNYMTFGYEQFQWIHAFSVIFYFSRLIVAIEFYYFSNMAALFSFYNNNTHTNHNKFFFVIFFIRS